MTPETLTYDERGLIPAIVQEAETGEVLMVAWMDRAAVTRTLETGLTHFWSRSRQAPWRKGETSGHSQHVQGVYADCDADTLLVQVHQDGVACHTGSRSCFFTALQGGEEGNPARVPLPNNTGAAANMLDRIERIVAERKASPPPGSYVAGLLAKGEAAVCRIRPSSSRWDATRPFTGTSPCSSSTRSRNPMSRWRASTSGPRRAIAGSQAPFTSMPADAVRCRNSRSARLSSTMRQPPSGGNSTR